MEIVFLLIPLALLFLAGAIAALFWALRKDQFDDLDNAAWRVVFEDREQRKKSRTINGAKQEKADAPVDGQKPQESPHDDL